MPLGRPTKFTPETADKILSLVEKGHCLLMAAGSVGVCRKTIHNWLRRGRSDFPEDEQFRDFLHRYTIARAKGILALENRVMEDAKIDGKMALEILERVHWKRWSKHLGELRRLKEENRELRDRQTELQKLMEEILGRGK